MGWSERDIPDQSGRVAVVTGANSGIGFETARALAERGADVFIGCRSPDKGEDALARLRKAAPNARVEFVPLDLASLESVDDFARKLLDHAESLDLLFNNAGVMMTPYGTTKDGFETQFGTNHLGHFALTAKLFPAIRRSPSARVICVSSIAHMFGKMNFHDLQSEDRYDPMAAYGQSKLANLLFCRELQRRLERSDLPTLAVAAHPGSTQTNLQQHSRLMAGFVSLVSMKPAGGALPSLYAATSDSVKGGAYYGPRGPFELTGPPGPARSTPRSRNRRHARRLWEESERLTGVAFEI